MTDHILVLGGTGKTGRRVAALLDAAGVHHRTAARSAADLRFDWDDDATWGPALEGARAVYLVSPTFRLDHAPTVGAFLDRVQGSSVEHVTLLSARGVEHAPADNPLRAIELDLARRDGLGATLLRPGWFLQDFTEWVWRDGIAERGTIAAPSGGAAEAFVDADDIAAVAVATLTDPGRHAGRAYTLTGPAAVTFHEVAARIADALGRPVTHADVEPAAWADELVAGGVPADYAGLLAGVLAALRDREGPDTSDDVEHVLGRPARSLDDFLGAVDPSSAWGRQAA
jgi:uncharacterized protein YbjT (DUF2867 family)